MTRLTGNARSVVHASMVTWSYFKGQGLGENVVWDTVRDVFRGAVGDPASHIVWDVVRNATRDAARESSCP